MTGWLEPFKVEDIDQDSGQGSGRNLKSSEDRKRRDSVVGEFSEPLIDFIEFSKRRNCEAYPALRLSLERSSADYLRYPSTK